jgi:hypothetical protein
MITPTSSKRHMNQSLVCLAADRYWGGCSEALQRWDIRALYGSKGDIQPSSDDVTTAVSWSCDKLVLNIARHREYFL